MSRCRVEATDAGVRFVVKPNLFLFSCGIATCALILYGVVTLLFTAGLSFEKQLAQWILLWLLLPMALFVFQIPLLITSETVEVNPEFLQIRWDFLGIGCNWNYQLPFIYESGYAPYSFEAYSHSITFKYKPDLMTHAFGRNFDYATAKQILDSIEQYQTVHAAPPHRRMEERRNEGPVPTHGLGGIAYRWP